MEVKRQPAPLRRRASRIALGAAAVYALYLAMGNVLLNTALGHDLANRRPERFVASWGTAWTLYPGQVRVHDLRIAGHTRRVVWSAQVETAQARIALLPLLRKELRVPRITAAGVTAGASLIDVVREAPPPRPGGWTIRFDRIVADDVRHAYFNDLVLVGDGQAEAGFVKVLRGGPTEVLPSKLSFTRGVVWRNGERLAWDAAITANLAIARHRREEAPGIRKLERTDFDIRVDAVTGGLAVEQRSDQQPVVIGTGGPGSLHAQIGWNRGSVRSGSTLQLSVPIDDDLSGHRASTAAILRLDVARDDMRLVAKLSPTRDSHLQADADLRILGTNVPLQDLATLAQRTSGHIASRWQFESLAWLNAFVPGSRVVSFDGAGSVVADLKFENGQLAAGSHFEVPHVAATANVLGNRFEGDARARVDFEARDAAKLEAHLVAVMAEFRVAPEDAPGQPYVHGKDLRVDAVTHGRAHEMADRIQTRLWFSDARVPDLQAYNRYMPLNTLRFTGGEGRLSGDLHFDRQGGVGRGEIRVVGRKVRLMVADLSLEGDVGIDTKLRRADLQERTFDVDGSRVSLTGVRATGGGESLGSDWWGDISLDKARLDWDKPLSLDGNVRVRMKDLGLLLALYSQKKDLPAWVGRLVDAGEADARGRVQWKQDTLLLDPFAANNERFDVMARLRLHRKQATGDLYASWGALSIGVELLGGTKDVHLVGARKWFEGRPGGAAP
jgi:hypothetical protein